MPGVRQSLAGSLALLFACNLPMAHGGQAPVQSSGAASSIKDQVDKLPAGALIEVWFTNKTKVRGYLASVEADGFSLKKGSPAGAAQRQVAFNDVKSVRVIAKTHTPIGAWIAVGAVIAVAVIVVVAVGIERHNE
jgi:hypothetical protein